MNGNESISIKKNKCKFGLKMEFHAFFIWFIKSNYFSCLKVFHSYRCSLCVNGWKKKRTPLLLYVSAKWGEKGFCLSNPIWKIIIYPFKLIHPQNGVERRICCVHCWMQWNLMRLLSFNTKLTKRLNQLLARILNLNAINFSVICLKRGKTIEISFFIYSLVFRLPHSSHCLQTFFFFVHKSNSWNMHELWIIFRMEMLHFKRISYSLSGVNRS